MQGGRRSRLRFVYTGVSKTLKKTISIGPVDNSEDPETLLPDLSPLLSPLLYLTSALADRVAPRSVTKIVTGSSLRLRQA